MDSLLKQYSLPILQKSADCWVAGNDAAKQWLNLHAQWIPLFGEQSEILSPAIQENHTLYWVQENENQYVSHPWFEYANGAYAVLDTLMHILCHEGEWRDRYECCFGTFQNPLDKSQLFQTEWIKNLFVGETRENNECMIRLGRNHLHRVRKIRGQSSALIGWKWEIFTLKDAPKELLWAQMSLTSEQGGTLPVALFDEKNNLSLGNQTFLALWQNDQPSNQFKLQTLQLLDSLQNTQECYAEFKVPLINENHCWFATRAKSVLDAENRPHGAIVIAQEITHLKLAQEATHQAHQEAEALHQAKTNFISCVSHEIRTPLTAVLSLSELLAQTAQTLEQIEQTLLLKEAAELMMRQINSVLDYSRLERGKITLRPEVLQIRALLDRMVRLFTNQAISKGLTMSSTIDSAIPELLVLDGNALEQILTNLLGNAIKFTSEGSIKLEAKLLKISAGQASLEIMISDTGPGIDDILGDQIFAIFYQADSSWKRKHAGIGLGLAIADRLSRLLDGNISFQNISPHGAQFRCQFMAGVLS